MKKKLIKWVRPDRIRARGRSKYLFYDHTKHGRNALTPLSGIFSRGIRGYLQDPVLQPDSGVMREVYDELESAGVSTFSIDRLDGGSSLFDQLQQDMRNEMDRNRAEIDRWLENLDAPSEIPKSYQTTIDAVPSITNPGWRLAIHPQILAIVNYYIHAYSKIQYLKYWINAHQHGSQPVASQAWHRDGDGTMIKILVHMNDVDERHGPFHYACGTHTGKRRAIHGATKRLNDAELQEIFGRDIEIRRFTGTAGTIVMANTTGYHKGGFVEVGQRHMFVAGYYCPWIDRSDYGLSLPKDVSPELSRAQQAAVGHSW